jgi:hypothetical protein
MNHISIIIEILIYFCGFIVLLYILSRKIIANERRKCPHKHNIMYVENVAATCEKITTTCLVCGKKTTKIEC